MKREKARIASLRDMPYEEYLRTPEWQETEKAALKRAKNRCQGCKAENVALSASHTTYNNLGCEQEEDLVVLCTLCCEQLTHSVQELRSDVVRAERDEERVYPDFSLGAKAAIFAPAAVVGLGLPALLHAPLPAEIFGLVAAFALAANSPKIYAELRESLPAPLAELIDGMVARKQARAKKREWNTWDRLMGRHLSLAASTSSLELGHTDSVNPPDEGDDQQDYLDLGPTLKPHADSLLSGRKVILGVSGSGKTNTMNVYCEELGKLDPAPAIVLFDTDDENRALCNPAYFPNPLWLEKASGLSAANAFQRAQTILEQRYQCIINLQSFEDEEAAWIMINMIKGVRAWQEARSVRIPCEIVLDEASVWLPQNPRESLLASILIDDPDATEDADKTTKKISLLALLQRVFFSTVVRRGRRRGMGFTLAAQRIAEIDKRALQGSWMFLMRQTQPADFREYQKFKITPEEAMGLLDGEAFVFAPGKPRERHRLRMSDSPHGGVTPGMEALRGSTKEKRFTSQSLASEPGKRGLSQPLSRKSAKTPGSNLETAIDALFQLREQVDEHTFEVLLDALPVIHTEGERVQAAVKRKLPDDQPTTGGVPIERPEPQRGPRRLEGTASRRRPTTGLPKVLRDALDAYVPGMSYRELGAALGYGDSEAREVFLELRRRGLLSAPAQAPLQVEAVDQGRHLRALPRPDTKPSPSVEEGKSRAIAPGDLAKAFALWQAGAGSVRKLESAAKAAGYSWSNGMCRALIDAMKEHGLIRRESESVL